MTIEPARRAVALVSGGLDSVVSVGRAAQDMEIRLVVFVNYGQRALERERAAVLSVVNFYQFPFLEVDAAWLGLLAPEGMRHGEAPAAADNALESLDAVWVPNRNGVFISVAAAYAEAYGCGAVVTGFNREEAREFPDNSADYVQRMNACLKLSTRHRVSVVSYTQDLAKAEIIELGSRIGAPMANIWSCYRAGDRMCGRCGSCKRLREALGAVGDADRPRIEFEVA